MYSKELTDKYLESRDDYNVTDVKIFELLGDIGVKNKDVLDLGCGDGRYACKFLEKGASSAKGIDISQPMINRAQERNCGAGFVLGDIANMPYEDNSFDLVFSNFVIQHCKDLQKPFNEIFRVLRKGGYLVCSFNTFVTENSELHNTEVPLRLGSKDYVIVHDLFKTDEDFKSAMSNAGLQIEQYRLEENEKAVVVPEYQYIKDIKEFKVIVCVCKK